MGWKDAFSVKFVGVGGIDVQLPRASSRVGGFVGRRVKTERTGSTGCLKTY